MEKSEIIKELEELTSVVQSISNGLKEYVDDLDSLVGDINYVLSGVDELGDDDNAS